jgi:hypothetical protein
MKKIAEEWKSLSSEELEAYKKQSEDSRREAKKEWDKQDAVREEVSVVRIQCTMQYLIVSPRHAGSIAFSLG